MVINIRLATREDVSEIIRLLADDDIGNKRERYEDPLPKIYYTAFEVISSDKNSILAVAEIDDNIVGCLQLTYITYLTYQGGKRALIEGVRIDSKYRGKGVGKFMLNWAIAKSKEDNCHLVQLTTDKKRPEALEFYKQLGFIPSHEGLKLFL